MRPRVFSSTLDVGSCGDYEGGGGGCSSRGSRGRCRGSRGRCRNPSDFFLQTDFLRTDRPTDGSRSNPFDRLLLPLIEGLLISLSSVSSVAVVCEYRTNVRNANIRHEA